MLNLDFKMSS